MTDIVNGLSIFGGDAGNSAGAAAVLTADSVITGSVGTGSDTDDYYRFTAPASGTLSLDLGGLSADIDLYLLSSSGATLASSIAGGDTSESIAFAVSSGATYYIRVDPFLSASSTYALAVDLPTPPATPDSINGASVSGGDAGNSAGAATLLTGNSSITGSVGSGSDIDDYYRFTAPASGTLSLDMSGLSADIDLYLLGSSGATLASSTAGGSTSERIDFTVNSGSTYYIRVDPFLSANSIYALNVTFLGSADDFGPSSTATNGTLQAGGAVSGNIERAGDTDWFRVSLISGHVYEIELEGSPTGGGTLSDPYLRGIYDAAGNLIAGTSDDDGGSGTNSHVAFTASYTGSHYIVAGAFASNTGSYLLGLTDLTTPVADDYAPDSTATNGSVQVGQAAQGNIEQPNDVDWFRVSLAAGSTYAIELEGAPTSAGTLQDTYLFGIRDAAGTLISGSSDDDSGFGLNSQVEFTPSSSGTYYIVAGAFGGQTGTYRLLVTGQSVADDFGQTTGSAGIVGVNESTTGVIELAGDQDWFAVSLLGGRTYQISLEGSPTNSGTLTDTYLRGIHDAAGALLANSTDDDGGVGANSLLEFTATLTGTYYLAAGAYGAGTGSYTLSVISAADDDDYADSPVGSGVVTVGGSASGVIEQAGDRDWFAVSLAAGTTYVVDLEGAPTSAGTLPDTYLYGIYDGAGHAIGGTANDDGGTGYNSQLEYTPTTSGTYYLSTGAYGNGTGTYRLSVSQVSAGPGGGGGSPDPSAAFNITVNYSGDGAYRSVFDTAAARWEEVIIGDLADVDDAQFGLIDDLLIEASVVPIDGSGGVLGQAAADWIRTDSGLPFHGFMQFDSADIADMAARGTLEDVILHEMGHVLGISGWFWQRAGLSDGVSYIGNGALTQFRATTGNLSATSVPVETDGGGGTAGSHWDEELLDRELMTGYAEGTPPMPLSTITIGALDDLGYEVNYGVADAFALALVSPGSAMLRTETDAVGSDRAFGPLNQVSAPEAFHGSIHYAYADKPLVVDPAAVPRKVEGTVTQSGETQLYFFETFTGFGYLVRLLGQFEKNDPATVEDIKGSISSMSFYQGSALVDFFEYSDAPLNAETDLGRWVAHDLSRANYIASLAATPQDDQLFGGAGDDTLFGGSGHDQIDGGDDFDTASFAGSRLSYAISKQGATFLVEDQAGAGGADTLTSIERIRFDDGQFELVNPAREVTPTYASEPDFLFDAVFYLLANPGLIASVSLDSAAAHYLNTGAAQGLQPNGWFDAAYYGARWDDLTPLNLDAATLFAHYNLYGVWEGRSGGPAFDAFDGNRYLADNPDVAAYVDANVADFLGSRSNGAIAHYVIYGADEGRAALDTNGLEIDLGYIV